MTSLIGIIPAIIVMYYILRSYDEYFKDTWLYGFLAGGLIMGMVFFVVHAFLDPYALKYSIDMALLLFVFAFALIEELAKYALLYFKKFLGNLVLLNDFTGFLVPSKTGEPHRHIKALTVGGKV